MLAIIEEKSLLKVALSLDAVVTGANGLAYLAAATVLDDLLGPTTSFLRLIGAFLLVYGLAVGVIAARPNPIAVEAVIAGNVAWVVASIAYAASSTEPTAIGTAWTVTQAIVVGGFAVLQFAGLRRR